MRPCIYVSTVLLAASSVAFAAPALQGRTPVARPDPNPVTHTAGALVGRRKYYRSDPVEGDSQVEIKDSFEELENSSEKVSKDEDATTPPVEKRDLAPILEKQHIYWADPDTPRLDRKVINLNHFDALGNWLNDMLTPNKKDTHAKNLIDAEKKKLQKENRLQKEALRKERLRKERLQKEALRNETEKKLERLKASRLVKDKLLREIRLRKEILRKEKLRKEGVRKAALRKKKPEHERVRRLEQNPFSREMNGDVPKPVRREPTWRWTDIVAPFLKHAKDAKKGKGDEKEEVVKAEKKDDNNDDEKGPQTKEEEEEKRIDDDEKIAGDSVQGDDVLSEKRSKLEHDYYKQNPEELKNKPGYNEDEDKDGEKPEGYYDKLTDRPIKKRSSPNLPDKCEYFVRYRPARPVYYRPGRRPPSPGYYGPAPILDQ